MRTRYLIIGLGDMPKGRQLLVFVFAVLLATAAFGQGTTGELVGTVTTGGAPLPGVTVTITSPALQGVRTTTTGEGGGYTFPSLPPGGYAITFELAGMQRMTQRQTVQLAATARADAEMK